MGYRYRAEAVRTLSLPTTHTSRAQAEGQRGHVAHLGRPVFICRSAIQQALRPQLPAGFPRLDRLRLTLQIQRVSGDIQGYLPSPNSFKLKFS
jgi:hypothetical protein